MKLTIVQVVVALLGCQAFAALVPIDVGRNRIDSVKLRLKRSPDWYVEGYSLQDAARRMRQEVAKSPPNPNERAEAEAKKAAIGMVTGAGGGLIIGGPFGARVCEGVTGDFQDKAIDTARKTLPAIYKNYREEQWELP